MVRASPDGKLALVDLIKEWTKTTSDNACIHIQNIRRKGLLPQPTKSSLGRGRPSHMVTASEWDVIKLHLPYRDCMAPSDLYVLQYNTVWDYVKIGRASDVSKRLCSLEMSHNSRLIVVASFPGRGHLERSVHRRLSAYRSTEGAGSEWFNVPAQYAIKIISELIEQNRPEFLSSSESEL